MFANNVMKLRIYGFAWFVLILDVADSRINMLWVILKILDHYNETRHNFSM